MDRTRALEIIDEAVVATHNKQGATDDVVDALRWLRDAGVERETLKWFWSALHGENEIGRTQNAIASRNRIKLLLDEQ